MEKLKPCPFCGAELEKRSNRRGRTVYMHPSNECIILKAFLSTDDDIMEWNRRNDDDQRRAISAIQSNRPTSGYTMLCEALDMAVSALREQEERENLKPLTLEELRLTHAPVWCQCELLDGGNGFWCLCINGKIIAPSGDSFDVEEIPNWVFLRSKPKEDA